MLDELARLRKRKTGRASSWDKSGRNADYWRIPGGESVVLADIKGPGQITHIWMTQGEHYREVLIKITWDDAAFPSVLCPLGDFFCLGHGMVNSFQAQLFTASTNANLTPPRKDNKMPPIGGGCALNCYAIMPFGKRARIELINESSEMHQQYFYIDYETLERRPARDTGYFHAEFRRVNPFGGWAPHIPVNTPPVDVVNTERLAWDNNYVLMETKGRGHYIGCNISVSNFQGTWWGEGDDMIWVDGYKWPPDLHGTGSEDYLNQAWGMQPNAYLRNGSSLHEAGTNGYQTSYVFHLENPVRFEKEIKVTIEHGHGNHLCNEMSSVAYWYAAKPTKVVDVPPVMQRLPVMKNEQGEWIDDAARQLPGKPVRRTAEMSASLEPLPTLHIGRSRGAPKLGQVGAHLAKTTPVNIGGAQPYANLRLGLAGKMLAVYAEVQDSKMARHPGHFWTGSAMELFAARAKSARVGQVVLLPAVGDAADEFMVYDNGMRMEAEGIGVWSAPIKGGYCLSALVPLELFGIDPACAEFMFDCAFSSMSDARGEYRRTGIGQWPGVYSTAMTHARVVVAR